MPNPPRSAAGDILRKAADRMQAQHGRSLDMAYGWLRAEAVNLDWEAVPQESVWTRTGTSKPVLIQVSGQGIFDTAYRVERGGVCWGIVGSRTGSVQANLKITSSGKVWEIWQDNTFVSWKTRAEAVEALLRRVDAGERFPAVIKTEETRS